MEKWFYNEKKEEKKPKEIGQIQATQGEKNIFIKGKLKNYKIGKWTIKKTKNEKIIGKRKK